jgi:hypothetical protein
MTASIIAIATIALVAAFTWAGIFYGSEPLSLELAQELKYRIEERITQTHSGCSVDINQDADSPPCPIIASVSIGDYVSHALGWESCQSVNWMDRNILLATEYPFTNTPVRIMTAVPNQHCMTDAKLWE